MPKATVQCDLCGQSFEKPANEVKTHNFCSQKHARKWSARRMAQYNRTQNPLNKPGGVLAVRKKRRAAMVGSGAGKSYRKFFGRHEHRAVAEAMIGRPLRPGEVVHHLDGNKLNNDPMNLEVLPSQAEHVKSHPRDAKGRWRK